MERFIFFCLIGFSLTFLSFAQTPVINEVMSSNSQTLIDDEGDYPDWIEIYNPGDSPVNLMGCGLSDNRDELQKWTFPDIELAANGHVIVFASGKTELEMHTGFKINAGGETLYLTRPDGAFLDSVVLGEIPTDVSFGRQPDGSSNWLFFRESTPGESNSTQGFESIDEDVPVFSLEGGVYANPVTLTLEAKATGATIYYTLDGEEPGESSAIYSNPLQIDTTTAVRARVKVNGEFSNLIATHSFIINKITELPIISLTTRPYNLWDSTGGVYTNWEEDLEVPVHLEIFEPDGITKLQMDVGLQIYGGWSAQFQQKSFAIFARRQYGYSNIDYRLFPDLPFEKYESFILRNSGGDLLGSRIRDAMMQTLVKDIDVDGQAYRPAIIYLNGVYWGLLNMREKINEHYIESHFGVTEDELDMLENNLEVIHGDTIHYSALLEFMANNDLSQAANYEYILTQMDIHEYLNYLTSEIYFANVDWPGWNVKFWRPRTTDGKWRWILFDLDDGFGYGDVRNKGYDNMIQFATAPDGPEWPNPPWSTFLLRKLLENPEFERDLLNRFADHLNTIWQPDIVVSTIEQMVAEIEPEIEAHLERFDIPYDDWEWSINSIKEFGSQRRDTLRQVILSEFDKSGLVNVAFLMNPAEGGQILLNQNLDVPESGWTGVYFQNNPIELKAIANPGYKFAGWTGEISESEAEIEVNLNGNISITALFEKDENSSGQVVINEINYNSAGHHDSEDWVELYNDSDTAIDISNWIFKDSDDAHEFIFPEGITLERYGFAVICRDTSDFKRYFPDVKIVSAELDFSLSNGGELVRLFNAAGQIVDSLTFDDEAPWPVEADGTGATLALKNPGEDNSLAYNWAASTGYGSPGAANNDLMAVENTKTIPRPVSFRLAQNYPNPFNPVTTISFQLPKRDWVSLKIYDITGREVASLIDGFIESGSHRMNWQASEKVASGVYIYRLQAGKFVEERKMLLLR